MKILIIVILSVFLFAAPVFAGSVKDSVAEFLHSVETLGATDRCRPQGGRMSLGVLGFHRKQRHLSGQRQKNIRSAVEEHIQKANYIDLAPSSSLGQIAVLAGGSGKFFDGKIRDLVGRATDIDMVVYFRFEGKTKTNVNFRLVGIAKNVKCQTISPRISFPLRYNSNFSDLASIMDQAAEEILARKIISKKLGILPFFSKGGKLSACSEVLQERLYLAIAKLNRDGINGILNDNTKLTGAELLKGHYEADKKKFPDIVTGEVGSDRGKGVWIRIKLQLGSNRKRRQRHPIISKRYIAGLKVMCDPTPQTFIERFQAKVPPNRSRVLSISPTKRFFKVGEDPATFKIFANFDTRLYCWYIGRNKAAYILLPNPEKQETALIEAGETKNFPGDFGLFDLYLDKPGTDLFGCFAPLKDLPQKVTDLWIKKWGNGGAGKNGTLTEREIDEFLEKMRVRGNVESYASVIIRK